MTSTHGGRHACSTAPSGLHTFIAQFIQVIHCLWSGFLCDVFNVRNIQDAQPFNVMSVFSFPILSNVLSAFNVFSIKSAERVQLVKFVLLEDSV